MLLYYHKEKGVVKMKKNILCMIFIIVLTLAGCGSPNVKYTESLGDEKIVVMKEGNTQVNSENKQINTNELESIKKISSGISAFYMDNGNTLTVRDTGKSLSITSININSGEEKAIIEEADIKSSHFQISPDRKRMLYLSGDTIKVVDFSEKSLYSFVLSVKPLDISIGWIGNSSIAYSDYVGNLHTIGLSTREDKVLSLDSIHKTNISLLNDMYLYIKIPLSNLNSMDKNDKDYSFYMKITDQYGNSLAYSRKDNQASTFENLVKPFEIQSYKISPDKKNIALYFEDKDNNSRLYVTDISGKASLGSISSNRLINISNEKVLDYVWSDDSTKLIYSTGGQEPGLYAVNYDGTSKNQLAVQHIFTRLDFKDDILAVDNINGQYYIYEIKLK